MVYKQVYCTLMPNLPLYRIIPQQYRVKHRYEAPYIHGVPAVIGIGTDEGKPLLKRGFTAEPAIPHGGLFAREGPGGVDPFIEVILEVADDKEARALVKVLFAVFDPRAQYGPAA
jgi:hypothetical protein